MSGMAQYLKEEKTGVGPRIMEQREKRGVMSPPSSGDDVVYSDNTVMIATINMPLYIVLCQ